MELRDFLKFLDKIKEDLEKDLKQKKSLIIIKQSLELLKDIEEDIKQLEYFGKLNDFNENIQANGFRSFKKINEIAFDEIKTFLYKDIKNEIKLENCLNFLKLIKCLNDVILEMNKKNLGLYEQKTNMKTENKLLFDQALTNEISIKFFSLKNELKNYLDGHLAFYMPTNIRKLIKVCSIFINCCSYLPFSLFIYLTSKQSILNCMMDSFVNQTVSWPCSIESLNWPVIRNVVNLFLTNQKQIKTQTIYVEKQKKWVLNNLEEYKSEKLFKYNSKLMNTSSNIKKDGVRIKLIQHSSKPIDCAVMFHCHGGAFIYHSPDAHEMYLHQMVEKIPNLCIFSVDYKLRKKYPYAHQDVLDAYLWLTSDKPEVEKLFGFKPKKIFLLGDSAGAFLTFCLNVILYDIQDFINEKNLIEKSIILPKTIFSVYGFTSLNKFSPSFTFSFIDIIIPITCIRMGFGSLIHGCENVAFLKRLFLPFLKSDQNWYSSNNSNFENFTNEFVQQTQNHPYLEIIDHLNFERFKDVKLYLVSSEFDLFLDANIELAKKWKGQVCLEVIESISHGFLQLALIDKQSDKGLQKTIQVLKELVTNL